MSRSSKPKAIHQRQGTLRPDRQNMNAPEPVVGLPAPPDWLPDCAVDLWHRAGAHLLALKVISDIDQSALEQLCTVYAQWREAVQQIREEGLTIERETKFGSMLLQHPACAIEASAQSRLLRMCTEFGMTPASRGKVSVIGADGSAQDPLENLLNLKVV